MLVKIISQVLNTKQYLVKTILSQGFFFYYFVVSKLVAKFLGL